MGIGVGEKDDRGRTLDEGRGDRQVPPRRMVIENGAVEIKGNACRIGEALPGHDGIAFGLQGELEGFSQIGVRSDNEQSGHVGPGFPHI